MTERIVKAHHNLTLKNLSAHFNQMLLQNSQKDVDDQPYELWGVKRSDHLF